MSTTPLFNDLKTISLSRFYNVLPRILCLPGISSIPYDTLCLTMRHLIYAINLSPMRIVSTSCELVVVRTALNMSYKRLGIARIGQQINGQFSFTRGTSVLYSTVFERGGFRIHLYGCRWLSKAYPSQPVNPSHIPAPFDHYTALRYALRHFQ
jgi:hypothetical protein